MFDSYSHSFFICFSFLFIFCQGGTHINHVVDQMVSKMMAAVKRKASKELNIKPFQIKNHLWVFVNCLVENPSFDSQTKENMTLNQKSFGSTCELTEKFIKAVSIFRIVPSCMRFFLYAFSSSILIIL